MFEKLKKWSKGHYSSLPWRANRSVYGTLVSEIMLQQTTVATVEKHFERFMLKYPRLSDLAGISENQILIDWKGLGYYRRARNLLKAAKEIETKFHGEIPLHYEKLISINGIGPYTANAILAIGANKRALCVDANLERVLARFYGISEHKGPKLQKEIYKLFAQNQIAKELKKIGARDFNEGLMDLGRSICKARSASCEICPLSKECVALAKKNPLAYPVDISKQKKNKFYDLSLLRIIVEKNGKYLAYKKDEQEWLSGQYELPTFILFSEDEKFKQYPWIEDKEYSLLPSFKTSITKYKITNYVIHASFSDLKKIGIGLLDYEYKNLNDNFSTASMKAIKV